MKTRHLLTAIALPALFAACTNEEFVEQATTGNSSLDDRRMVDVPAVIMNFGEEADTRLALGNDGKFVFESTDQLGACLMDEISDDYLTPGVTWSQRFDLVNYIQTNYKFAYNTQNGRFENNALMCEGNYFFYLPYDPTMNTREAFEQDLNPEQELKVNADGTLNPRQTVLDNQVFLGHSAIYGDREDHESLNVNMKSVFAYPAFRIAYSSPEPITITKVAFKIVDNEGKKETEGKVIPFNTTLKVDPTGATFDTDNQYALAKDTKFYGMVDAKDGGSTAEQISVSMPDNAACKLSSGKTLAGYVVIPAGIYNADNKNANKSLWMYVYTNKGVVKTYLNQKNEEQEASGAPSDNVWTEGAYTDFQPNNGMLIDMGFSYEAISAPTSFRVSETEDFEAILGWQKDQSVPTTLTATIVGKDVVLTKAVYDVLKNKNLTLNLTTDDGQEATVTVAANAPADALDRVNILDVKGSGNKITVVNKANLIVATDLDHDGGNSVYDAPAVLINEGSMTFTALTYNLGGTEITNKGTFILSREDDKQINLVATGYNAIDNYGSMVMDADVLISNSSYNKGINNYTGLIISEGAEVSGRIINKKVEYTSMGQTTVDGTWSNAQGINEGWIVVNETGRVVATDLENTDVKLHNTKNEVIAEAIINNSGIINGVKNRGTIKMVTENARLITAAESTGEIDNTECSSYVTKQEKETIFCVVDKPTTASALKNLVLDANAKRLDISGKITIDPEKDANEVVVAVETVNVMDNLTVEGKNYWLRFTNGTEGTTVNVLKGTTEIAAQTNMSLGAANACDGTINVNTGCTLIISASARLDAKKGTIAGNVENYGVWYHLNNGAWETYK